MFTLFLYPILHILTFALTTYNSNKFKTIFTSSAAYSWLSQNMGWGYDMQKVQIPYFMTAGTDTSDDKDIENINEKFGGIAPLKGLIENYHTMTDSVMKVRARVVGAKHQDMIFRTDRYMTAWMLYQLQKDKEAEKVFIGESAEILNNSN